jgi:hypothetical protein
MSLRSWLPLAPILLLACSGIATIDIFFSTVAPQRDGLSNISIRVTEGAGASSVVLEDHVEAWDVDFDMAGIRVPFGGNRVVSVQIETNETPPRILASGRSLAFRLEDGDDPLLNITMGIAPPPGTARVMGASSGRVASSTVSFSIALGSSTGVVISNDPFFAPQRTIRFNPGDTRLMLVSFGPVVANVSFPVDGRCADRAGCPRTVYFRSIDPFGTSAESDTYTASFILDPFPPRLLEASVRYDDGAVLGTPGSAEIVTDFDEPVVQGGFLSLTGGSAACDNQVEIVDGRVEGTDFSSNCAGTYSVELTATDLAGNSVRLFEVATLLVDRVPPPPIDLTVVTATCAGAFELIQGAAGAAEPRATVDASGAQARAAADGSFVISAPASDVELTQLDDAGNVGTSRFFEVPSCD